LCRNAGQNRGKSDGYNSLQLGYGDAKTKNTSKALQGHFEKLRQVPKAKLLNFATLTLIEKAIGDVIKVEEIFAEGDSINAVGTSKGKGFQGVVKRHNFPRGE
jgi:large subunit ribosomal protein L3